jgi:deoxyribodipyrimidine photo-lyase
MKNFHPMMKKRNEPCEDATSNLSPYLHFGHINSHEIFYRIQEAQEWHPGKLSDYARGQKEGWWGMGKSAEAFLDQLITWRELGFICAGTIGIMISLSHYPDGPWKP